MEDISWRGSIPLLTGFQVFGVQSSEGSRRAALSPALRSRFTEIAVAPYTADELEEVLHFEVHRASIPRETTLSVVSTLRKVLCLL